WRWERAFTQWILSLGTTRDLAGRLGGKKVVQGVVVFQIWGRGIVPLFDSMLVQQGEGSGTPTKPHHTPSLEAESPSYATHTSPTLPPVTTTSLSTVTQSDTPIVRQYTRRIRIAQSFVLLTVVDEPASPLRDVSQGEACPTDSGFIADQDMETIDQSSALPHDSAPRVTSPVADEGTQEVEINRLKERVKLLEDREGVAAKRSGDDAPIKGRSMDEGEAATKRIRDDSEEMAVVLTSMDAATVLASGVVDVPTGSGSIPSASTPAEEQVPTGSDVVPTASLIFATATVVTPYRRRKGKEDMVESETLKKQKVQKQIDAQVARELEEQLEREDQRRDYYMAVIRNNLGWKVKDFRGVTFKEVEAKFNSVWKQIKDFILMGSKEQDKRMQRKGLRLEQESVKKQKTSDEVPEEAMSLEEVPEEKVKEMMQLVPIEEVYVEALQVKHPINDWKDKEIFMLVEKDYPLRKGLALVMINYKLQVKNYSQMSNDLILKIYKIANSPRQQDQHDDVPVVLEPIVVDKDEDPKEDEFEEEEYTQNEEDDMEVDIEEDENEPELTYLYEEMDPLNLHRLLLSQNLSKSSTAPFICEDGDGLFLGLMRRDLTLFGWMASLSRRLCGHETVHALVEKKGKAKDEFYGKLILDLGNEVSSSMKQGTDAIKKLVEKIGNVEDKVECKKLKKELKEARIMPPKSAPLTQAAIRRMIKDNVNAAICAERARQANVRNGASASGPARDQDAAPAARDECAKGKKVRFAATTLQGPALSWWNAKVVTMDLETVNRMPWTEMKQLMTTEFCLIEEIQIIEHELWNPKYLIKCHKCGMVRYKSRYCKEKNVATDVNALPIPTCYDCGEQGHTRNQCQNKAKQKEVGEICCQAYAIKDAEPKGPNVITGASYEVELVKERVVSTNTILKGFTLNLVNHVFEIDLILIELGMFNVIIDKSKEKRMEDVLMIHDFPEAEDGPTNFALMAYISSSSSSSDSEVSSCSKACLKSVEARLEVYKKNEAVFEEGIKILKLDVMFRDKTIIELRRKFEKAEKERDDLKLNLEKFEGSSKNLSMLLDSQQCEGYHAVPPLYTGSFIPSKRDLVFADKHVVSEFATNLPGIAKSEVKTSESKLKTVSEPIIEDWVSDSEDENEIETENK
nr:hypothetical protein [Tanacetum cinerariifolium]